MISSEESEKIRELRSKLPSDLLTKERYGDDYYLIRWLRARNLDVEKAAEMLTKSMQWRKENEADEVFTKNMEVPLKYRKIYPTGLLGTDDEDCLVELLPLGRFCHRILMDNEGMETAMKYNMIWVENMLKRLEEIEEKTGKKGLKFLQVVDMEYYSYKELTYGPAREFLLETNNVFAENFPELLKSCIVINAPKVFTILWNMIRPFMNKATVEKVQIYGGGEQDVQNWKAILRSKLKPENVPKRWGGTREGSDEFCSQDTEIWIDGPISLKFFTECEIKLDGIKTEKVKARDKLGVEFLVEKNTSGNPTQEFLWKVRIDSHDIGFSIIFQSSESEANDGGSVKSSSSEDVQVYPECRVDSKQGTLKGSHVISSSGKYTLVFDNRYSYTRSKTVHYFAEVVQATEQTQ